METSSEEITGKRGHAFLLGPDPEDRCKRPVFNVVGEGSWREPSLTNVISRGALLIPFSKCQQSIYFLKGESKTAREMQASPGAEPRAAKP